MVAAEDSSELGINIHILMHTEIKHLNKIPFKRDEEKM